MELSDIRKEIDQIDAQLLPLLTARMECAKKVAVYKKEHQIPVLNSFREEEILDRVEKETGEYGGTARVIFSAIMSQSRALQHQMLSAGKPLRQLLQNARETPQKSSRIACLGSPGSYSHLELLTLYPKAQPIFCPNFSSVFSTLEKEDADLALVPIENSSAGSVLEVYDLLLKYRYYIIAAGKLCVNNVLASKSGTLDRVTSLYSHPQPLMQCSTFVESCGLSVKKCRSTTEAAAMAAKDPNSAALCGKKAAEENHLKIVPLKVQNCSANHTRFLVLSRELCLSKKADKISVCFNLPHRTGSLNGVLSRFAAAGMNLTKIGSRPIIGKEFEYDFYLDFSGNIHDPVVLELLCSLWDELPRFSFLGNYSEN